jgi:membrane protease YdiL (CAAX protease family)
MAGWLDQGSAWSGLAPVLVYAEVAAGLAAVATVLHFRRRRGTAGELRAVRTYFAAWAVLLLAVPCATIAVTAARPLEAFASFGLTLGRTGLGLALAGLGLPVAVALGLLSFRDPEMRAMYPLAKAPLADGRRFAAYELSYLVLYYLPWEFVFRGALLLPLVPAVGLVPALALQTVLSTLFHIGHPRSEILAAAGAGLVLGLVAYTTGSVLYTLVMHAAAGISLDASIYFKRRRAAP